MKHQSCVGWGVSGSVERGGKNKRVSCLGNHSLAVAGFKAGVEAHNCSNVVPSYRLETLALPLAFHFAVLVIRVRLFTQDT